MLAASLVVGAASAVLERARPGTCLPEVHGWMKRASWFAVMEAATVVTLFLGWLAWVDVEPLFDISDATVAVQVALNWLLSTFVFYWWHRARHSSDALWRWTHQLHHSPRRIETITAFYKHPFEVAADTLLNLVLSFVVLGVSTEAFLLHVSCVACSQFFVHMNVATPRWIGYFLSRPEMHRIHHELGVHKNNYADLPLWDMLFGTYENPYARPVECGFAAGREARVLDMLLLRDTHATKFTPPKRIVMSEHSQFALLGERRFAPFFWTQFLGAMNDNVFKNGMIIFMAFGGMTLVGMDSNLLVNAAGAVFILPFVLFSAFAGQLADKYEKTRVIRGVKIFEIVVMALAAFGFVTANLGVLFISLFLMGLHSTLFGPVKYAIMPQSLASDELVGGNALVESGTFVAILVGTIAGGVLVALKPSGPTVVAVATMVLAIIGYLVSRAIPAAPATDPSLKLNWNPFTETAANLRLAAKNIVVWRSMLGISWLWFYGAMLLNQFANMSKDVLGGNEQVATLLLAVFAVGVAVGSLMCERLSGKKVEIGLVPFGSIGMSVFAIDLYFATKGLHPVGQSGALEFISKHEHWRVVFDLFMLSVSGGLYSVPLYALIQERSEASHRSRIIAANNILNAIFMVASAVLAIVLIKFAGFNVPLLILTIGILNALIAAYIYTLTPEFLLRFICWILISFAYRLRVKGLESIPDKGPVIIVANHVSYVDALVITAAIRRPIQFVMDHNIFKAPGMGWVFRQMKAIPIASAKEDPAMMEKAFERVRHALGEGEVIGIFPEGKLTRDGEMNPFRPGIEKIVEQTGAPVVPLALRGLWGSFFSRTADGQAFKRFRGFFNRIELVSGALVPAANVKAAGLEATVREMRGEMK